MKLTTDSLINALSKYNKPKTLIIDNGNEFVGKIFKNALKNRKIKCHAAKSYTPEENGKIERWQLEKQLKNCILLFEYFNSINSY